MTLKPSAAPYRLPVPTSPLAPVELPNVSIQRVKRLDREGWQLYGEMMRTQSAELAVKLIRRILPDATDVDLACLGNETIEALYLYVVGRTQDYTARKDLT